MVLVTKAKRPQSIHSKRRHGRHHKKTPDYHKPYWPYLPIGIIIGLGILANSFWGTVQQAVLGYAATTSVSSLVQETNVRRTSEGLATLSLNNKLNEAAQAKANDMAARNYWSHNTPEGNPPWLFFGNAGYAYSAAGENLAYGFDTSDATVAAWMNSPGHRANILNNDFTEVGFGIAHVKDYQNSGEQTVIVAMYGAPHIAGATTNLPASDTAHTVVSSPPTENTDFVVASEPTESTAPGSQHVARMQLFTHAVKPWTLLATTAVAILAIAAVFFRHGRVWHRVIAKGERFIVRHKFLDIALLIIAVVGYILTRTAGTIH